LRKGDIVSDLAEFARELHEKEPRTSNVIPLECVEYQSKCERLNDIRAVIFDIYGTIINYWRPEFDLKSERTGLIIQAFNTVIERFGMKSTLEKINPSEEAAKTLNDFYNGLIALNHEKSTKKGILYPEVKIENIWSVIIAIFKRNGYEYSKYCQCQESDFPRFVAYTYNYYALGRTMYPGVVNALTELKQNNIVNGILSNAQFYTPIDLTLMIREQSNQKYDDLSELFEPDLTFYSYEYGVAKPNQLLFRRLYDALYEFQILPEQTVFIGNDLETDIQAAADVGMKTAFFCGDLKSTFFNSLDGKVIPDITFTDWNELPSKISFFAEENMR
jgi:putative hydrolase of the HAD superfamily